MSQGPVSPVTFNIEYPESLSRLHLLLKSFLGWIYVGIPHGIILTALGFVVWIVSIVAFFAILFTGRYPRGLFNLVVGYYRWGARVNAYSGFMVDNYPPFSLDEDDSNPVGLKIEYPERLSRKWALLKFFLGWIYVLIPHGIALFLYFIAAMFVLFLSWWAILFTGGFPRGFFNFIVGMHRWELRVNTYLSFLRDEYPPFNGRP